MTDPPALPPLATLRAFEAAARRGSFLLAAAELHLTPSAISKQIRQLEEFLGQPVFERLHREVRLTAAGAAYVEAVAQTFEDLRAATGRARVLPARDQLILWCAPWFLKAWLLPRLDRFRERCPDVQLQLRTGESSEAIDPGAQIAIRLGLGDWPRVRSERLFAQEVTAVCTPAYLRRERIAPPYRYSEFDVLDSANTPHHLRAWEQAAGFDACPPHERIVFQSNETAFAAARADHGLALVNPEFVQDDIRSGALVRPWPVSTRTDRSYWLAWHDRFGLPPAAAAFRKWVLSEAGS